jgi:glycerophosphoryl diester phosphodiesterase
MKIVLLSLGMIAAGMAAEGPRSILVHGHRGARAVRPENTIPAFEYAIAAGVDVLELDMAVTKDNVVVVSHDPLLHGPVCKGPVKEAAIHSLTLEAAIHSLTLEAAIHSLTLREVKEWECGVGNPNFPRQQVIPGTRIPTLDEVFALAPKGKFEFNIETKIFADHPELSPSPEEFVKLVLAEVKKHHLESRVMLQSFDFRTLHAMRKIAPEIRRVALYEGLPKDFVEIAKEADAKIVSPQYRLVTAEQVAKAHAAELQVVPWTPDDPADWDRLIASKVDAIITDDPAGLIEHLKRK